MAKGDSKSDSKSDSTSTASAESTKLGKDSPVSTPTTYNTDNPESASSTPATPSDPNAPTAEDDREQLEKQARAGHPGGRRDVGRAVKVDVNPAEAEQNSADWLEGRDENDVVEVEGQRETAGARMARNGVFAPEKQVGAATEPTP